MPRRPSSSPEPSNGFTTPEQPAWEGDGLFDEEQTLVEEKMGHMTAEEHGERFASWATSFLLGSIVAVAGLLVIIVGIRAAVWLWSHVL